MPHPDRPEEETSMKKLGKMALLALLLVPAVARLQAQSVTCPAGCGYKYDPVTRCCVPDPRFDCVEFCF